LDNPVPDPVEEKTISNPNPKNAQYLPDWTPKPGSCTPLLRVRLSVASFVFCVQIFNFWPLVSVLYLFVFIGY